MALSRITHGARLLCYINGTLLGRITSFEYSSNTNHRDARGLDVNYVIETIPTTISTVFTMTILRVIADGGAEGAGLVTQLADQVREKYFTILLVDRVTDLPVFQSDYCTCTSQSWSVAAKGVMIGRISCEAIYWNNESAKTKPNRA